MGRVSSDMIKRMKELYAKYCSEQRVANELGVDRRTVHKYVSNSTITDIREQEVEPQQNNNIISATTKNEYLEIPSTGRISELSPAAVRCLYAELSDGKQPLEIIAKYGFPPETVEREHKRVLRMKNVALIKIQEYLLAYLGADFIPGMSEYPEAFRKRGYLTLEETISLIDTGTPNKAWYLGARPTWAPVECVLCKEIVAFVNPMDVIGRRILWQYRNCRHINCGNPFVL